MTEILGIVMERKLYGQFCKTLNQETQDEMMALLQNAPDDTTVMHIDTNPAFDEHLKQYELYFNSVMGGALGPTAQYWAIYIFMVNRIHRELMRALRTNDVNSYISILPAVIDIFFGLNIPNYARCGVLFLQKLSTASPQTGSIGEGCLFKEELLKKCYRFDSRANSESRCSFSDERYHRFPKLRKCSPTMVHHFYRTGNSSDRVTSTYRLDDRRYTSHSTTSESNP